MNTYARKSHLRVAACYLALAALLFPGFPISRAAENSGWERFASLGMGVPANGAASAMAFYGGRLYVGTNNPGGCQVWSYDGVGWEQEVGGGPAGTPVGPGFGNSRSNNVSSMAVFHSKLYLGIRNAASGCRLWSYDGVGWSQTVGAGAAGTATAPGFGSEKNGDITSMAVFGGRLYAGTYNPEGCQVWSYDGKEWRKEAEGGFGDADNYAASSMASYSGRLYVGTYNNDYTSGCQVWSYDGKAWTREVGGGPAGTPTAPGFGDTDNRRASCMAVYDSLLYVGTYDSSGGQGCQVWSYDGANWTLAADKGFGSTANLSAASMVASGLDLFVGTYNEATGCEIWRHDGETWHLEGGEGLGYDKNTAACALALQGGELAVGTQNLSGCQVWRTRASHVLYFAEGYTGPSFNQYLCLGNHQPVPARASITYLFPDGVILERKVLVPAESRMTIHVNADVGADREVSMQVTSDRDIATERPMYFRYGGAWEGGHNVMGAPETSTVWYFAEGYTGPGFEQWICVLNPGESDARLTFYFQTQERGEVKREGYSVPARSRGSFKVNEVLGSNYQVSLKLVSSVPVVAERPMYFDYLGTAAHHWQGGHCVMGATGLAQVYFFAEGTTRPGFEEWLTIQNPNPFRITVNASFLPGPDQGAAVERIYSIDPCRRFTVFVPREAGAGKDVSVVLASTNFFLAERPMYFRYGEKGWEGGDCVIGAGKAGQLWYLAEGYTGPGFHTWLCILNPGPEDARVLVSYYTQEEGPLAARTVEVPTRTRYTLFVNHSAGEGYQLSIRLVSDQPLVVERPMYFDYLGLQGGHNVIGRLVR